MSVGCREGKEREEEGDGDWEMHHSMMFKADDDGVVAVFVKLQQVVFSGALCILQRIANVQVRCDNQGTSTTEQSATSEEGQAAGAHVDACTLLSRKRGWSKDGVAAAALPPPG